MGSMPQWPKPPKRTCTSNTPARNRAPFFFACECGGLTWRWEIKRSHIEPQRITMQWQMHVLTNAQQPERTESPLDPGQSKSLLLGQTSSTTLHVHRHRMLRIGQCGTSFLVQLPMQRLTLLGTIAHSLALSAPLGFGQPSAALCTRIVLDPTLCPRGGPLPQCACHIRIVDLGELDLRERPRQLVVVKDCLTQPAVLLPVLTLAVAAAVGLATHAF
mmetsp:Transcript_28081/g.47681  ORF Transcript_28081/g.47681 Transcript_28081/m.47681 type:complete len:217 (+) Transcript_28081:1305-1955(+)